MFLMDQVLQIKLMTFLVTIICLIIPVTLVRVSLGKVKIKKHRMS